MMKLLLGQEEGWHLILLRGCSCIIAKASPFPLCQPSLAKGFAGAAVSLTAEGASLCFVLELVLGWLWHHNRVAGGWGLQGRCA